MVFLIYLLLSIDPCASPYITILIFNNRIYMMGAKGFYGNINI